jgi:hypothetical protein
MEKSAAIPGRLNWPRYRAPSQIIPRARAMLKAIIPPGPKSAAAGAANSE